jgi:hypothetical protein
MTENTEINNSKIQKKADIIQNFPEEQTVEKNRAIEGYKNDVGDFLNQIDEEYKMFKV